MPGPPHEAIRMTAGTAHRVDTNVHIGGYLIAADAGYIARMGITRIVKLFADTDAYPGGAHRHKGVAYLVVPAEDSPDFDIRRGAMDAVLFIQEGIANCEQILVHCHAGISRSATVVLLHLMINRNYSLDMALARLRNLRSFIRPNPGFMRHLLATDARLKRLRVGDEREYVAPPPAFGAARDAPAPRPLDGAS